MFVKHLIYREGSRPSQVFPYCEKEQCHKGGSDGQCGDSLATYDLEEVSCPYCQLAKIRELNERVPGIRWALPIHYSVHPVFSRDGKATLTHWEAMCGEVKIYPEVCLATRNKSEITCEQCLNQLQ